MLSCTCPFSPLCQPQTPFLGGLHINDVTPPPTLSILLETVPSLPWLPVDTLPSFPAQTPVPGLALVRTKG